MSNRLRSLLLLCGRRGEHQDIFLRENKKNLRRKKGEEGREKEKPSPVITNYSLQFCGRGQTAESGLRLSPLRCKKGKSRKSDNCSRRRRRRKNRGFRSREEEAATYDFCFPAFFFHFSFSKSFLSSPPRPPRRRPPPPLCFLHWFRAETERRKEEEKNINLYDLAEGS